MDRIPLSPPLIPLVPKHVTRPLWSVMIPAYNCSEHLKLALKSVLQQDPGADQMQIEVVDDCSDDADLEQIVKEMGNGRVKYYRQPKNVGSLRNFETCLKRANGYYIHLLHGDDRVKDGFYKKMGDLLEKFPEAGAAFCAFDLIKEDNSYAGTSERESDTPCILDNWLYRLAEQPRLQYVCMVVKRHVYEKLGSFYIATYGEDWEMWVRIAKHFPTAYTPEALGEYRIHQNSITRQSFMTGNNIKDMANVIDKITGHLPEEDQQRMKKKARRFYAGYAIKKSYSLWYRCRNKKAVKNQLKGALSLYNDPHLKIHAFLINVLMMLPYAWLLTLRKLLRKDS